MREFEFFALALIKEAEGFSGVEYICPAGYKTIGYGRNLETNPLGDLERTHCMLGNDGLLRVSQNVATDWLITEISKITFKCEKKEWFEGLDAYRRAVIIDLIYNLGFKKWDSFKKCQKAIIDRNFGIASAELEDSRWFNQVGRRGLRNVEIMKFGKKINEFYKN